MRYITGNRVINTNNNITYHIPEGFKNKEVKYISKDYIITCKANLLELWTWTKRTVHLAASYKLDISGASLYSCKFVAVNGVIYCMFGIPRSAIECYRYRIYRDLSLSQCDIPYSNMYEFKGRPLSVMDNTRIMYGHHILYCCSNLVVTKDYVMYLNNNTIYYFDGVNCKTVANLTDAKRYPCLTNGILVVEHSTTVYYRGLEVFPLANYDMFNNVCVDDSNDYLTYMNMLHPALHSYNIRTQEVKVVLKSDECRSLIAEKRHIVGTKYLYQVRNGEAKPIVPIDDEFDGSYCTIPDISFDYGIKHINAFSDCEIVC